MQTNEFQRMNLYIIHSSHVLDTGGSKMYVCVCIKGGFGLMRKVHTKSNLPDSIFSLQHKDRHQSPHAVAGKKDEVTGSKVQALL